MKTIKIFLISIFFLALGLHSQAQSCHGGGGGGDHSGHGGGSSNHSNHKKTVAIAPLTGTQMGQIFVYGNCELCKTRIEKAALAAGASIAAWNPQTKSLSVVYDAGVTSLDAIGKQVAFSGHDNDKSKADENMYSSLPKCCKYDRKTSSVDITYTCPMHPEVQSSKPSQCPKCGMDLVK